jgi:hypothetical protein
MDVQTWKNNAKGLTNKINSLVNEYNAILNDWEEVRDEAGDPGKHDVDDCFRALSEARDALCSLRGGSRRKGRSQRKQRRTRKHRR